jgi:hypothetical protein
VTSGAAATGRTEAGPTDLLPFVVALDDAEGERLDIVPIDERREESGSLILAGTGELVRAEMRWTALPGAGTGASWRVDVTVRSLAPDVFEAALTIALRLAADTDPDWLVPGCFLGENRPADSRSRYPRWVATDDEIADRFTATEWWFRSDRAATPAVLATGGGLRVALATRESSALGPTGVGFGTVGRDGAAAVQREIRLSFPYREAPVVYDGSAQPRPADRPVHHWKPGAVATLELRAFAVPLEPEASTPILRDLAAWLAPSEPVRPPVTATEAAALAAEGLLRWHLRPSDDVLIETAAFARRGAGDRIEPGDRLAMHVAWLSGAPAATALLVHGLRAGDDAATGAGRRVLDAIATNLAPCGTFWGQWTADRGWTKGWTPGPDALHARTLAEAALFVARAIAADPVDHPAWRAALRSNASFVAAHQAPDGSIPGAWNGTTGKPLSWAGTAGLGWVPALVEAAGILDDPTLLDAARQAGDRYAREVEGHRLAGAPEDVDLGPTSEDGYVGVTAYVALARVSDGPARDRWLRLARIAADWMLGFRYAYDVAFPADSELGRIGFRSRGADLASPANQHLHAYGLICTGELVELARLTGDPHYADAARRTFACFRQTIIRSDGELGGRRGMTPERYYQTRYDGPKGGLGPLSHAWCLGLLLHAAELARHTPELADA